MNTTTLVTALYDIRGLENNKEKHMVKGIKDYLQYGSTLSRLPFPVILFTEDSLRGLLEELFKDKPNCTIITLDFAQTYFYTYKEQLTSLRDKYIISNLNPIKDTPLYIILNNNKFFFIEEAIKLNLYQSTHFMWIDFGLGYVAKDCETSLNSILPCIPDKIKQMCINPYVENIPAQVYHKVIYHNMAGGLFSGSKENMLRYANLFKAKYKQIVEEGWYQLDEAIMSLVVRENPDLFSLYYGDYEGIIANYQTWHYSPHVTFSALDKLLNHLQYQQAYAMLQYLKPTMMTFSSPHLGGYLRRYIICNYYVSSEHKLDGDVRDLLSSDREEIRQIRMDQMSNLKFYTNFSM